MKIKSKIGFDVHENFKTNNKYLSENTELN
jgi:hypothetical protein